MKRKSIHNLFSLLGVLLLVATFLHNVAGFFSGHWFGRLLIFHERGCRTISIETGIQNAVLATSLALTMEKITTNGLAPAVFGPIMNVNVFSLASGGINIYQQKKFENEKPEELNLT